MLRILMALGLCACLAVGASAEGTSIGGFIDASYYRDINMETGEFGLDQVELDVIHEVSSRTFVRGDLEWVKNGEDFDVAVEQGFITHTVLEKWDLTFGKFNAPIGFELLDAPDMYQYSHALVFDHGLPTNLTGLMVGRDFAERFNGVVYCVNGWDQNAESNKLMTYGGRLGFNKDFYGAGFSVITGKEGGSGEPEFKRTVVDVDLSCRPEGWVFGGEVNFGQYEAEGPGTGKEASSGEETQNWFGLMFMAHRELTDILGLTVRYDFFDDQDGHAFGMVGGEAQVRQAVTVAPTIALDEGLGALVEVRVDMSDQDAFFDVDGKAKGNHISTAFEVTYSWD